MKRKYHGLFSIMLILISLGSIILYAFQVSGKMGKELRMDRLKPLPDITIPGQAAVKEIGRLEKKNGRSYLSAQI